MAWPRFFYFMQVKIEVSNYPFIKLTVGRWNSSDESHLLQLFSKEFCFLLPICRIWSVDIWGKWNPSKSKIAWYSKATGKSNSIEMLRLILIRNYFYTCLPKIFEHWNLINSQQKANLTSQIQIITWLNIIDKAAANVECEEHGHIKTIPHNKLINKAAIFSTALRRESMD